MATTQHRILAFWNFSDRIAYLLFDVCTGVEWFVFALPAKCDNWYAATVYVQPLFTTMGYHKLLFGWAGHWRNDRFYLVAMGCAT